MAAQGKMERRLSRQSLEEPFTPDNFDALSKEKYDLIAGKRTLTMVARTALERAPRKHHNAELLQTAIVDAGKHLKAHGVTRLASMSTLPPHDQILDTLLMVGEARISEWLEYDSVQLTDVSTGAVEKMPSGRALVTNKRLLLLRTTENDDAVLHLPDRRPAWPCYLGIFGVSVIGGRQLKNAIFHPLFLLLPLSSLFSPFSHFLSCKNIHISLFMLLSHFCRVAV